MSLKSPAKAAKRRRLYAVLAGLAGLGIAAGLILTAFSDNLVFFHSPSDVAAGKVAAERRFRLGGLVEKGSVERQADGATVHFRVTDTAQTVTVAYRGVLPDLFREGQGVIAEGVLDAPDHFTAQSVLAKHDEKYVPRELADSLKKQGYYKEEQHPGGSGTQ